MNVAVKEILDSTGSRKVEIFRRESGSFGFSVWEFSEEPLEGYWFTRGNYSECFAPDAATAESEARSRVPWLAETE